MLDLASVRTGYCVLDIAAGTGDQSIDAARLVATDLSPSMLDVTASTGLAAGPTRV